MRGDYRIPQSAIVAIVNWDKSHSKSIIRNAHERRESRKTRKENVILIGMNNQLLIYGYSTLIIMRSPNLDVVLIPPAALETIIVETPKRWKIRTGVEHSKLKYIPLNFPHSTISSRINRQMSCENSFTSMARYLFILLRIYCLSQLSSTYFSLVSHQHFSVE